MRSDPWARSRGAHTRVAPAALAASSNAVCVPSFPTLGAGTLANALLLPAPLNDGGPRFAQPAPSASARIPSRASTLGTYTATPWRCVTKAPPAGQSALEERIFTASRQWAAKSAVDPNGPSAPARQAHNRRGLVLGSNPDSLGASPRDDVRKRLGYGQAPLREEGERLLDHESSVRGEALQNQRLLLGCFPWKFKGGEAAFCRAVAFTGEWKP